LESNQEKGKEKKTENVGRVLGTGDLHFGVKGHEKEGKKRGKSTKLQLKGSQKNERCWVFCVCGGVGGWVGVGWGEKRNEELDSAR